MGTDAAAVAQPAPHAPPPLPLPPPRRRRSFTAAARPMPAVATWGLPSGALSWAWPRWCCRRASCWRTWGSPAAASSTCSSRRLCEWVWAGVRGGAGFHWRCQLRGRSTNCSARHRTPPPSHPSHPACAVRCRYLVDRANLLLFLDQGRAQQQKRLLSLQEAHDLMLGSGVPLDRYLVFCKLLRAGYIVQRHPARWVLGPREDLAQAWAGWGQQQQSQQQPGGAAAASAAAAAAAPQPALASGSAAPAAPAAAPPAGPATKRRKVDPQQQRRSGAWWPAGTTAAGQQDGSSAASASPWLSCLPPGFMDSLPRCTVLPDAAQRARSDFPRMAPLPSIPLADLQPLAGPEGGRHLLVSWLSL